VEKLHSPKFDFFGNIKTTFPASEPVKISIFVFFINPLHVLQQRNTDAVK
jgi:hypothetical protein